jgi:four helix bundle protein
VAAADDSDVCHEGRRSTFDVLGSSFAFVVRRSSFIVRGSWFVVRGSWFVVRGSRFAVQLGMPYEQPHGMPGVKRYEDLEVWQLADELKREVYALTDTGPAAKDAGFRSQIRDSAASSTKNIAEGFGRFQPGDFAHFMEFSVSSTMETKDSLKDGVDRGYFIPQRVAAAQQLAERCIKCSTKFIVYLKREAASRARRRRRTNSDG